MNQTENEKEIIDQKLADGLKCIKDRCDPPERFWSKTFYVLLILSSLMPLAAHNMTFADMNFNNLRMPHGLLPLAALTLRNTYIPYMLPLLAFSSFVFSFKFRLLRSASWLACLTILLLFASGMYTFFLALFIVSNPS